MGIEIIPSGASGSGTATALKDSTGTVDVSAASAPSSGQVLTATDDHTAHWADIPTPAAANGLKSATTTVAVSGATAPSSGQVLTATGGSAATWQTPAGGAPSGSAGGALAGTYPNPTLATYPSNLQPAMAGGWISWVFDPALSGGFTGTNGVQPVAGTLYLMKVPLPNASQVISTVDLHINTLGSAISNSYVCLYDSSGARQAITADVSSQLTAGGTGLKAFTLASPWTVTGGATAFAWIGIYIQTITTTSPKLNSLATVSGTGQIYNGRLTAATARYASQALAGPPATPNSSITPSSNVITQGGGGAPIWAAIY